MQDSDYQGKRHFAVWQKRDRVLLLGYSKRNNDVLAVRLDMLPEDERTELINIALNPDLQRKFELTPVLTGANHTKSGQTWMTNIAMRLRRGDGSVIRAYVKNLDEVDPDQLSYYKGYNPKGAPGTLQISEAEKAAVLGDDYRQRGLQATTASAVNPPQEQAAVPAPVGQTPSAPANEMNALASVLSQMTSVLQRIDENTRPKKAGRPKKADAESTSVE